MQGAQEDDLDLARKHKESVHHRRIAGQLTCLHRKRRNIRSNDTHHVNHTLAHRVHTAVLADLRTQGMTSRIKPRHSSQRWDSGSNVWATSVAGESRWIRDTPARPAADATAWPRPTRPRNPASVTWMADFRSMPTGAQHCHRASLGPGNNLPLFPSTRFLGPQRGWGRVQVDHCPAARRSRIPHCRNSVFTMVPCSSNQDCHHSAWPAECTVATP